MITLSEPQWQTETQSGNWQQQLSGAIRQLGTLLELLELDPDTAPYPLDGASDFPLRVPQAFIDLMRKGDWFDPLLLQVLPLGAERDILPGYSHDPLEERNSNPAPGLIHKYQGRVLLIASPACAVHCRYCFRRHFPYNDNQPSRADWQQALDYIRQRPDITEVILSGGDPLALSDIRLKELVFAINDIGSVKRIRFHTRFPVVLPDRLSQNCIDILSQHQMQTVMVIHCNHAKELSPKLATKLKMLRDAGVTLLNQSVLLKGVNDDGAVLRQLSERLFEIGVLPYYLHVVDRIHGAGHFELPDDVALDLHRQMMETLPGYLVPKLVREDPAVGHKVPL